MRVVVLGHVDHGKSTLIGRLFHEADALPAGRYDQLAAAAARRGQPFEWASLTDGLQIERDQNVTVDTTQIVLRTPRAAGGAITFIDAPGHRQFLRNMVTGAAQADLALLVVDAGAGVSEETRRHALLLTLLGITDVIACVTKIDLVDDARVCAVQDELSALVGGLERRVVARVAVSARDGRGLAELMGALVCWTPSDARADASAFVFSVQDVYRHETNRVLVGRVEAGDIVPSRPVRVWPAGHAATAEAFDGINALTLREPLFVTRGDVLASPDARVVVTTTIEARLFWIGTVPLTPAGRWEVRLGTQRAPVTHLTIARVIDAATLEEREDRSLVPPHDVADVTLTVSHPVVVDPSGAVPHLARFVLVDAASALHDVTGGGVILPATRGRVHTPAPAPSFRPVTAEDRRQRFGHGAAVVWLTGLSGAGKSTLALGLERALVDRGWHAIVIDGDRLRFGLTADLGFSPDDRRENIRRAAEVATLFAASGAIVIAAFISPYAADRARARAIATAAGVPFLEVFVDASLDACEARDAKGLYAKARAGQLPDFTGVTAPYEAPAHPDVTVRSDVMTPDACVATVLAAIVDAGR